MSQTVLRGVMATLLWIVAGSHQTEPQWRPPSIWDDFTPHEATVEKDLIPDFAIGSYKVVLEKTLLADVGDQFGVPIGRAGDASEAVSWVCLVGQDQQGPWTLWIESAEIDGPMVGGFLMQQRGEHDLFDDRCGRVDGDSVILPVPLRLGMAKPQVIAELGPPTFQSEGRLVYSHHRVVMLTVKPRTAPQPFDLDSDLYIRFDGEIVDAFQVWHTTSS